MSGGGSEKRARAASEGRSQEDRTRKGEAVSAINKLFGTGEFREQGTAQPGAYTNRSDIAKRTAAGSPFLKPPELLKKYRAGTRGRRKEKEAIFSSGEDPLSYQREKSEFEAERDRNKGLREDLYAGNRDAVLDVNTIKLDRDLSNSERQLKFALGRSGLFAGSEDIAQRGKQREAYDTGVLQSTSLADQSAAGFRGADERTRLDVISQIESGIDSGTALNNAQRGLELSAQNADANAKGNIIGNVFDDAGLIYQNYNRNQGTQDARNKYGPRLGAFFNNDSAYSGTKR